MYNDFIEITIPEDRKALYAELKEKYNPEGSDLRIYQQHLTKTLIEFDQFCKEHDIKYSLAYGTMLGAVRHKGFIPWDDDADLFMDRYNYEKLHSLMKGKHHELTPSLSVAMGIRPTLWSAPFADIDIFILDESPDNFLLKCIKETSAIVAYSIIKAKCRLNSSNKKEWYKIRPWYFFIPLALFASLDHWKKYYSNISLWFNNVKSTHYQCYNNTLGFIRLTYNKKNFNKYATIEFEGHHFPIFEGYKSILADRYGNYMDLPKNFGSHNLLDNLNIYDFKQKVK